MSLLKEVFGKSPFGALVQHAKKAHECVKLVRPLMEATIREDYEEVHRLQDAVCKLEYEADQIKQEIRAHLPRRYFLPVSREDLDTYLHYQDRVADCAEDFAIVLLIRKTKIHPALADEFLEFVDQVVGVCDTLMAAAEDMETLAETSFSGAEARQQLERISSLNTDEWKADRMQRTLSKHVYELEKELDPITIIFYEKMMRALSGIADAAENTGDWLRLMILKS
jgi:predicted phosphate transport protein (TIGR00153 family)